MKRLGAAIAIALVFAAFFYVANLVTLAGAHPGWADHVLLSGILSGTILAVVTTRLSAQKRMISFTALAIMCYLVANNSKARFAASFGEDIAAAQIWYWGWHAICGFFFAAIIAAAYRAIDVH